MTDERLGVYRPEEHIDNPKDYADNKDARQYDPRLRGLIQPIELEIDPQTGMVSLFSLSWYGTRPLGALHEQFKWRPPCSWEPGQHNHPWRLSF